jgi:hypothetical protein
MGSKGHRPWVGLSGVKPLTLRFTTILFSYQRDSTPVSGPQGSGMPPAAIGSSRGWLDSGWSPSFPPIERRHCSRIEFDLATGIGRALKPTPSRGPKGAKNSYCSRIDCMTRCRRQPNAANWSGTYDGGARPSGTTSRGWGRRPAKHAGTLPPALTGARHTSLAASPRGRVAPLTHPGGVRQATCGNGGSSVTWRRRGFQPGGAGPLRGRPAAPGAGAWRAIGDGFTGFARSEVRAGGGRADAGGADGGAPPTSWVGTSEAGAQGEGGAHTAPPRGAAGGQNPTRRPTV